MQNVSATDFKARCLAILDQVERTGEGILVTKHGRPVAQVLPASRPLDNPSIALRGTGRIVGDVVSPVLPPEAWDVLRPEDSNSR
jgi:prevent-host-death family protein